MSCAVTVDHYNKLIMKCLVLFIQGYRGGLGEGENAKEVRPLVVLAKESR